jgi:hypothetical protein
VTVDVGDTDLYRQAIRPVLRAQVGPADLWSLLEESGWSALADDDPVTAIGLLFEEQGRTTATTCALDVVVALAAGQKPGGGVVHPVGLQPSGRVEDGIVSVYGVLLARSDPGELTVNVGDAFVSAAGSEVTVTPVRGIDPALGLRVLSGRTPVSSHLPGGTTQAETAARRALAHELVGVAETMLAVAAEQVTNRYQFGRPIAAFQAVQHRLADVRVAIESARSSLAAAWREDEPLMTLVAKAAAGRAALTAAKHCQQVCGAIGFTVEHPMPALVRRALILDMLYGSASEAEQTVGEHLLVTSSARRPATPWNVAAS